MSKTNTFFESSVGRANCLEAVTRITSESGLDQIIIITMSVLQSFPRMFNYYPDTDQQPDLRQITFQKNKIPINFFPSN